MMWSVRSDRCADDRSVAWDVLVIAETSNVIRIGCRCAVARRRPLQAPNGCHHRPSNAVERCSKARHQSHHDLASEPTRRAGCACTAAALTRPVPHSLLVRHEHSDAPGRAPLQRAQEQPVQARLFGWGASPGQSYCTSVPLWVVLRGRARRSQCKTDVRHKMMPAKFG